MKDVSSLMDGELDARKARSTIQRVEDQDELWDAWSTFHLIRDTLQGNPVVPGRLNQRLHERLLEEPAPAPVAWWRRALGSRRRRVAAAVGVGSVLALALALAWFARPPAGAPGRAVSPPMAPGLASPSPGDLDQPRLLDRISAHRPMLPLDPGEPSPVTREARP